MFASLPTDHQELADWGWPQFEPYYQDLNNRSLSPETVADWLADWSSISKSAQETYARLYVAMTLNTADPESEKCYTFFLGEVYPQIALKDPGAALANYRRALALGVTKSLPELYAAAGAKFAFDAETLREAVELMESAIAQQAA
jgi:oligoendopeptidase F